MSATGAEKSFAMTRTSRSLASHARTGIAFAARSSRSAFFRAAVAASSTLPPDFSSTTP
jgi:hypothetical protein